MSRLTEPVVARGRVRVAGLLAVVIAAGACGGGMSAGSAPSGAPTAWANATADDGAKVVAVRWLSDRMVDLRIDSPAMGGPTEARLLLPRDYASQPDRRWPVLYMLHGATTADALSSFTRHPEFEEMIGSAGVIVVTPEGGDHGFYSDWYNGGKGGPPRYETYHLVELPKLLQAGWRASDRMAVGGISMGGFGAMYYAGKHPGMFVAAASLSGVVDTKWLPWQTDPQVWGAQFAQADVWQAHNPTELAAGLRGTTLYVSYGNGQPGPLDPPGMNSDRLETQIGGMNDRFVARLHDLGIDATVDAYGPGTHTWPYWSRALKTCLPMLLGALEE